MKIQIQLNLIKKIVLLCLEKKKDILIRKRFNCKLVFRENNFDNTSWVFGTPFLSGYSFTFDYEKSSIDIFSDEQILNIHNSIGQKEIMIIDILLCCSKETL